MQEPIWQILLLPMLFRHGETRRQGIGNSSIQTAWSEGGVMPVKPLWTRRTFQVRGRECLERWGRLSLACLRKRSRDKFQKHQQEHPAKVPSRSTN